MAGRGSVKKRIVEEVVGTPVKKVVGWLGGKLISREAPLRHGGAPPHDGGRVNAARREQASEQVLEVLELPEARTESDKGNMRLKQSAEPVLKEPVIKVPELPDSPPSTSSQNTTSVDKFLQASPFLTKKDARAKQWPKVNMSRALEHKGSVLFEEPEQKGKWTVMELCYVYSDTVVVPLIIPTPL